MAIENPEIQKLMAELQQLSSATSDAAKDTKELSKAEKAAIKALDTLATTTKGFTSFGTQVGKGETGLKSLNTVLDAATAAITGLTGAIPLFGSAISEAIKGIVGAGKMAVEALDKTAQSFTEVGKVGGLAATGMTELRENLLRSGLSLEKWQKQIITNSESLAQFRGLTSRGAKDFSEIVGDLSLGTDDTMRRLGLNNEEIAASTAAFIKQQTMLGKAQNMSNRDLAEGTKTYARELDLISKITGQSREAIQKQQEAALNETRFRAVYEEMMATGQEKSAKQLMSFQTTISGLDKEAGQGLRDLSAGVANTDAARKLLNSTQGQAATIIADLKSGNINQAEAQIRLQKAINGNIEVMRQQGKYNTEAGQTYIGLAGAYKIARAGFDRYGNVIKEATNDQVAQTEKTDALTDSVIQTQKNLEKMNVELNKLGFELLPTAATVVDEFVSAMRKAIREATKLLGVEYGDLQGRLESAKKNQAQAENAAAAEATAGIHPEFAAVAAGQAIQQARENRVPLLGGPQERVSQRDLRDFGLKLKQGAEGTVQRRNAYVSPALLDLAQRIQAEVPGFANFTSMNDDYHKDKGDSNHNKGIALDFVLGNDITGDKKASEIIVKKLKELGASKVRDEYNDPSPGSTGGHIHAEVSGANGWSGLLSGPTSGYRPNVVMHGNEQLTIRPATNTATAVPGGGSGTSVLRDQLEELIRVAKAQLSVEQKLLSMQA